MTTVAEHAERIRVRLYATSRGRYNKLASSISASGPTIHFADAVDSITTGWMLGCEQELMLVRSVDKSSKTVTVIRGFMGTEPVRHTPTHLVEIAPKFPYSDIVDTMKEEIDSWPPKLWRPVTVSISTSCGNRTYDVTGSRRILFGLDAELALTNPWPDRNPAQSRVAFRLLRRQPRETYPSANAVQLNRDPSNGTLRFTYAGDFDLACFEAGTDLEKEVGIESYMLDVLTYGVMWRLMSGREVGRADMHAAGETRKAEDIPAGLQTQLTTALLKVRDIRIANAANRLRSDWPYQVGG